MNKRWLPEVSLRCNKNAKVLMSLANNKRQNPESHLFLTAAVYKVAVECMLSWQQYCCGAMCPPGGIAAPGLRHQSRYLRRCVFVCDLQRQPSETQINTRDNKNKFKKNKIFTYLSRLTVHRHSDYLTSIWDKMTQNSS